MLIEFSGLDCAGKSTQIDLLKKDLENGGLVVKVVWSRGGYTPGIMWLKNLVRWGKEKSVEQQTDEERLAKINRKPKGGRFLLWLSIIDLIIYWGMIFPMWSRRERILLCDRYYWDTLIDFRIKYPNVQFEKWLVWRILNVAYKKPDCSFVLTITPQESMRRSTLKFEPFPESEERRKYRLELYMNEIKKCRWKTIVDCMRSIDSIYNEIRLKVHENLRDARA